MPESGSASPSGQTGARRLRAVVDTDVFVSGLMGVDSPPRRIVDAWLDQQFTLVTSLTLLEELVHVLSYPRIVERIRVGQPEVDAILAALLSQGETVPGALELPSVTGDPKDDAVVACAVEGKADFIVTGDEDLLAMGSHEGTRMVTPRQFLRRLLE
jgi:putative PIN family toxin of toxin-antitoxin system